MFSSFKASFLLVSLLLSGVIEARDPSCEELLSTRNTVKRRHERSPIFLLNEFLEYKKADWENLEGKVVRVNYPGFASDVQEILMRRSFNNTEQHVIDRIFKLSKNKKFLRRAMYEINREWREFYLKIGYGTRKYLPLDEGIQKANTTAKELFPEAIEVGAWIVKLANGKELIGFHTSSREPFIESSAVYSALEALLSKIDAPIEYVQFFHNHPEDESGEFFTLSEGDQKSVRFEKKKFFKEIPLHIYALINRPEGYFVAFHQGL